MALHPRLTHKDSAAGFPRKEEHATGWEHRADFDRRLNAIDFRHAHIGKEEIRAPAPGLLHGLPASIDGNRFVSALIQNHGEGICDDPLVICHQDSGSFREEHAGPLRGHAVPTSISKSADARHSGLPASVPFDLIRDRGYNTLE